LGVKTGIELPGEYTGLNASPDTKIEQRKKFLKSEVLAKVEEIQSQYAEQLAVADESQRRQLISMRSRDLMQVEWELAWHDYDTIISAIGQGDTQYSALELANYVAVIANGGTVYQPYFVQSVEDPTGLLVQERTPVVLNQAKVSPSTLEIVREGMYQVTRPPDGTAAAIFAGLPPVAAKTGTAEVFGKDNHALVVGYAPYHNPEIAVAVVMEYAGRGGAIAGQVVKSIFSAYLTLDEEV
jgi:penicillin-binding protein 2